MVYSLRHTGWQKGKQVWSNDVAISITAHHLTDEERADIALTIQGAMNAKYLHNVRDHQQPLASGAGDAGNHASQGEESR